MTERDYGVTIVKRVGVVANVETVDVTEVVAVDLPLERPVGGDRDRGDVGALDDVRRVRDEAPGREARGRGAHHERGAEVLQDGDGERAVEAGVRRDRESASQDVRVRIGVRDDHVRSGADDVRSPLVTHSFVLRS